MSLHPTVLQMGALMPELEDALAQSFDIRDHATGDPSENLSGITGIATSTRYPVTADLLARMPDLEVISSFGVGTEHLALEAAQDRGIAVYNTPEVLNDDTANMALALALALTRRIVPNHQMVIDGRWGHAPPPPLGTSLSGKTVGIAGLGAIGTIAAERFRAFGCRIAYFGRTRQSDCTFEFHATIESLAEASDLLVATLPGGKATDGLIGASAFRALGAEGYFINIGRGSIVDEPSLIAALQDGVIAGAGLDVFAKEPDVSETLRRLPNVVVQPHQASATRETRRKMADLVVQNLATHYRKAAS